MHDTTQKNSLSDNLLTLKQTDRQTDQDIFITSAKQARVTRQESVTK